MKTYNLFPMLNLQLFAEGTGGAAGAGDGGTAQGQGVTGAAALPQTKGAKSNPLADVKYGIQEDSAPAAEVQTPTVAQPDRNAEFEKLIKGEYKDLYDARVQNTIQNRLKASKETVDKYNALTPTLEILAKKYGVSDPSDIEALNKAIEEDDSFFEAEALERNMTVQQLKEVRKMERENADLKRQMQEQTRQMQEQTRQENANKLYARWMEQEQDTKEMYPSFSLRTEMKNPKFLDLIRSNVDVRTAYEVVHKDDIIAGAMQFTAKNVEQKIANKIQANGARPVENGNSSQGAAVVKSDVSQLSKADRDEIRRRVARGEKIRF